MYFFYDYIISNVKTRTEIRRLFQTSISHIHTLLIITCNVYQTKQNWTDLMMPKIREAAMRGSPAFHFLIDLKKVFFQVVYVMVCFNPNYVCSD